MFDPLHKWLGIPPHEQPPDHYRLLGLKRFESDPEVIDFAADKHLNYLRRLDNGENAEQAAEVANQVSQARLCLIDSNKRAAYDAQLRALSNSGRNDGRMQGSHSVSNAAPVVAPAIRTGDPTARSSSPAMHGASWQNPSSQQKPTRPRERSNSNSTRDASSIKHGSTPNATRKLPFDRSFVTTGVTAVTCLVLGILAGRFFWPQQPLAGSSEGTTVPTDATILQPSNGESPAISREPVGSERAHRRQRFKKVGIPSTASTEQVRRELVDRFPPDERLVIPVNGSKGAAGMESASSETQSARESTIVQAKQLYELGLKAPADPRLRYSAWSLAANRFLEANDYRSAMEVIADMDAAFHDFDLLGKQGVILAVVSARLPESELSNYMEVAERYFESCMQAERFDLCNQYGREVERRLFARKPRPRMTSLGNVLARSRFEERWYHEYQDAVRQLATRPKDPDANLLIGEYLAVARGRWSEALPYLLSCSDETMRVAAQVELARKENNATAVQVADAWDDAARGGGSRRNRAILMLRAYDWYRTALLDSTLEVRLRAEEKIQGYQMLIPELLEEQRPMLSEST